jgi:valyl-tRNA synthetase
VLWKTTLLLAPFLPYTTEEIAQTHFKKKLKGKSVHLENWPKADEKYIYKEAEEHAAMLSGVISEIRKKKSEARKPLNVPVEKAVVTVTEPKKFKLFEETVKRTMAIKSLELKKGKEPSVKLTF